MQTIIYSYFALKGQLKIVLRTFSKLKPGGKLLQFQEKPVLSGF